MHQDSGQQNMSYQQAVLFWPAHVQAKSAGISIEGKPESVTCIPDIPTLQTATSIATAGALSVNGNTVLGSSSGSQTVTINSPMAVNAGVTVTGSLTASAVLATSLNVSGNTILGATSSQTVTIYAATNLAAPVTATAPVNAAAVTVTGTLTATGNAVLGSSSSSSTTTVN